MREFWRQQRFKVEFWCRRRSWTAWSSRVCGRRWELRRDKLTEEAQYVISIFKGKTDVLPRQERLSWRCLCDRLAQPAVRAEKDGLAWSPATFNPGRRLLANVTELSLLVLDYDHGATFVEA